jgi:flagellar biosynthesis regulator FlaF
MEKLDFKNIDLLKKTDPAKYKAMTIASLLYFSNEELVPVFVEDLTKYINYLAGTLEDGKPKLKYTIPKESIDIDRISTSIIEDIQGDENVSPEMITARLKSLVNKTLDLLKEAGVMYTLKGEEEYLEQCLGYFDQILLCKEIATLADNFK